ncbi:helix-turn-helix transcriptional regulator [Streptomyces sp. MB09-01]|uniref:helix-turn-helix domain-containing protein n=1 Tax=Streptomyces sp. MB09-01 TaxID=3028666 RepID=UPI00299FA37B|nr:helix-turn-helix transcriptional regulator [Streptomyces sp. MB09-01]MDX3535948.1 helix-turn-helix transcriptional regulator [Streptomyces sp. MB09-01]
MSEGENFARLMRELKERGGLSYGALARRLHTSTSTLHRYCNGDALPAEFAVVDRFARACGASPGEAVDLHRAWLLAGARRRAGAPPGPGPESEPRPEPESGSETAVVVVGEPAVVAELAGGRPWYRRRAAVVTAAGVAAGAVAVALLAAAGPEPRAPRAGAWTGTTGTGSGPGAGTAAPAASAGASGTESAPAPAPGATSTTEPSSSPGGPGPASVPPSASPPVAAPPRAPAAPLKAAVRSHVWTAGCDHAYLAERGPGSVPPPPVEADAPAWASAQRAVHAGRQIVEVTLHGTGPGAVVLEDLQVRVSGRRTPPAWNVYQMSQGCGGSLTPAAFAVNLDAPRPLARPVAGNDAGGTLPAPAFPMRVSAAEPVVLRVEAVTTGCDCDWSLDLRWSAPSGSGTLRIDDDGRPLRTSAAPGRPVYGYAADQGRWGR